jgi:hypothetical protein
MSLSRLADEDAGPALLRALTLTNRSDLDTSTAIADALGHVHYAPAGAEVLARLKVETDRFAVSKYIATLAALQYQPAMPEIEKRCRTTRVTGEWLEQVWGDYPGPVAELALVRLTAAWGAAVGSVRLHVLPSAVARPDRLAALFENVGDSDRDVAMTRGIWTIDGRAEPIDMTPSDGNPILYVNGVGIRFADLSRVALAPGRHTVSFALAGATSNVETLDIAAP